MLRVHCAASARAGAKAGITSRENSASERNDSASVMSPKASHDTK